MQAMVLICIQAMVLIFIQVMALIFQVAPSSLDSRSENALSLQRTVLDFVTSIVCEQGFTEQNRGLQHVRSHAFQMSIGHVAGERTCNLYGKFVDGPANFRHFSGSSLIRNSFRNEDHHRALGIVLP